jgi:ribosomal protein S18 acetylase RimI-like enzyme
VAGLEKVGRFGWMETQDKISGGTGDWLTDTEEVGDLLETAFPESYAWPGGHGVRRWAGIRDSGRLLTVAAEAWPVPGIGFLAGVATHPDARGRGLAARLCAFVTDELLRDNERVALFVDYWNEAALRTYRRLGFTLRPLAAAATATGKFPR